MSLDDILALVVLAVVCFGVGAAFGMGARKDDGHPAYASDFKLATNFCKGDAIYSLTKTNDIHVVCLDGREHTFSVE